MGSIEQNEEEYTHSKSKTASRPSKTKYEEDSLQANSVKESSISDFEAKDQREQKFQQLKEELERM